MLLVVKKGREAEVERIFEKWDLHAVHIGDVTTDGKLRVKSGGEVVAEIPNQALTDDAPVYRRPMAEPEYLAGVRRLSLASLGAPAAPAQVLRQLLAAPEIASKRWVYTQYDHMVRTNTVVVPGMGAGVIRVKGTSKALALSVDCNARFVYLDPFLGAQHAVAEAARNVACAGGLPIGATNCLNFGNPQRPEIMWQFARAVEGMGAACRALDIPITGGNVSLYNETDGRGVLPTPVLGVVGLLEDARRVVRRAFRAAGDAVVLLGRTRAELGGSGYLHVEHDLIRGVPPALDLAHERRLQTLLVELASAKLLSSAHDCAEGGLAVALAECCFDSGLGVETAIDLADDLDAEASAAGFGDVATLFGESASRVVVSTPGHDVEAVLARAAAAGVPAAVVGRVGGDRLRIAVAGRIVIDESRAGLEEIWSTAIERFFERRRAIA
jgi:phosphoribosylformylglycinamidine synthase subunit PurL